MKTTFLIAFFTFSISIFAQTSIDSLLHLYDNENQVERKIELLDELVYEAYQYSLDSSIHYNLIAVDLAKSTNDYELIVSQHHDLAKLYIYNGDYTLAIETYKKALPYAEESGNAKLYALAIHSLGNGYLYKNEFDPAIEQYLKALTIRDSINDTIGIAASTNNIGLVYWKLDNYDLALQYYSQSLEYELLAQNHEGIASSYNNIGMTYWKMEVVDSAIFYIKKSLDLKLKHNVDKRSLSDAFTNLGVLYRKQSVYDSALIFFQQALQIDKVYQDKHDIGNTYTNIATTYAYLEEYDLAINYSDSAENIALQINDFEVLMNVYDIFAVVYKNKKQYSQAYDYLRLHLSYNDSVYSENMTNQIAEMQTKYETEKKEQEIELQNFALDQKNKEIKLQQKILYSFIAFFAIVFVLSIFLTRLFLQKRKANNLLQQKNVEIMQQNEEIEAQANNLNEAFEKIRSTNDELLLKNSKIEDQKNMLREKNEFVESSIKYASTIQNASLPLETEIDKFFDNTIIFLPKDIVSGDFYFFSNIKKDNKEELFFVVSDCTGHGVPGAFMSMIGIRLLNKYINENKIECPAEILERLNLDIVSTLKQNQGNNRDGMDMIICKFTEKNSTEVDVVYAGAKRSLYFYNPETTIIERIKATRKSIGGNLKNNEDFTNNSLTLDKNSIFYLFTDGLPDQNNIDRKRFGTHKLINLLQTNHEKDIKEQGFLVLSELEKWQAGTNQRDDITFVGLKLKN